jgi:hypothetical protein
MENFVKKREKKTALMQRAVFFYGFAVDYLDFKQEILHFKRSIPLWRTSARRMFKPNKMSQNR